MMSETHNRHNQKVTIKSGKNHSRCGLVTILIVTLITIGCLIGIFVILYLRGKTCTTSGCVKAASTVLKYIDNSVDPCDDFYGFVCGNFIRNAYAEENPSPVITLGNKFKNQIDAIIVNPIETNDSKVTKSLKTFYAECMNDEKMDLDDDKTLWYIIVELGGWPLYRETWNEDDFTWVEFFINAKRLGVQAFCFIDFGKYSDPTTRQDILTVEIPQPLDYLTEETKEVVKEIMSSFYKSITDQELEADVIHDIDMTVEFMINLKKIVEDVHLPIFRKVMTIRELEDKMPVIAWMNLINQGLGLNITSNYLIAYDLDESMIKLIQLLSATSKRIQANYLIWNTILDFGNILGSPTFEIYETLLQQVRGQNKTRHRLCIEETQKRFPHVTEIEYVRQYSDPVVREEVANMVENMKAVFEEFLLSVDWMDEKAKQIGVEKVKDILYRIGGSDEMYNDTYFNSLLGVNECEFSTDNIIKMAQERQRNLTENFVNYLYENTPDDDYTYFFKNVLAVNAFFVYHYNLLVIPAPLLQDIFFDKDAPGFMNYGALGRVIGHEIMHSFTGPNQEFYSKNRTASEWWRHVTENEFTKRMLCVIEQYNTFNSEFDSSQILNENIADFISIDVAYKAYQKWVEQHGTEKQLPGVEYTPNQIFWIQANTFLCFRKIEGIGVDFDAPSDHGVPKFRVTASVRNSRYFSKDFECPPDSPMNPTNKCNAF